MPRSKGHPLIVPTRHIDSFSDLGSAEQKACLKLLEETKQQIKREYPSVSELNIGINNGLDTDQTIFTLSYSKKEKEI
jgi:ATP adenylyltransferase